MLLTSLPPTLTRPPAPVYPVLIGKDDPARDISISNVKVSQTSFEDAPVTVQADITHSGYSGQAWLPEFSKPALAAARTCRAGPTAPIHQLHCRLRPKKLLRNNFEGASEGKFAFSLQVRPEKSGVLFYRLQVSAKTKWISSPNRRVRTEATLANNIRTLVVDRGKSLSHPLCRGTTQTGNTNSCSGLEEDEQVQLVALVRIAKREPKFAFRKKGASNPLSKASTGKPKKKPNATISLF